MSYPSAPTPRPAADAPGWATALVRDLVDWVQNIRRGPQAMTVYTVATLPDATKFRGCQIAVSTETGGFTLAVSDATNWRRVQDRNVVS